MTNFSVCEHVDQSGQPTEQTQWSHTPSQPNYTNPLLISIPHTHTHTLLRPLLPAHWSYTPQLIQNLQHTHKQCNTNTYTHSTHFHNNLRDIRSSMTVHVSTMFRQINEHIRHRIRPSGSWVRHRYQLGAFPFNLFQKCRLETDTNSKFFQNRNKQGDDQIEFLA